MCVTIFTTKNTTIILWVPVFQCMGILIYFSLNFEPNLIVTILIFLSALIPLFILYRKCAILCIAFTAVLIRFTTSKMRTELIDTKILGKERYVKDITATVKDINDKGLYKEFLLYEIKNSRFKLDNIRVSVRTEIEKDVKIGDQVRLSQNSFLLKSLLQSIYTILQE